MTNRSGWLGVLLLVPSVALGQDAHRAELLHQASDNISSALAHVEEVDQLLDRKATAHQIIGKRIGRTAQNPFVAGLRLELSVVVLLLEANKLTGHEIIEARNVLSGKSFKSSLADIQSHLVEIDTSLRSLESRLKGVRDRRNDFKARLASWTNAALITEPGATETLLQVQQELAPDSLDNVLMYQLSILTSVIVTLNIVK